MNPVIEWIVAFHIFAGGFFALVGSFGLLRLPDLMTRLHSPTKATTLGVGGALMASAIYFGTLKGHLSIHEILITLFLFLTAPLTAHFIAKAYLLDSKGAQAKLPPQKPGWATFEATKRHRT